MNNARHFFFSKESLRYLLIAEPTIPQYFFISWLIRWRFLEMNRQIAGIIFSFDKDNHLRAMRLDWDGNGKNSEIIRLEKAGDVANSEFYTIKATKLGDDAAFVQGLGERQGATHRLSTSLADTSKPGQNFKIAFIDKKALDYFLEFHENNDGTVTKGILVSLAQKSYLCAEPDEVNEQFVNWPSKWVWDESHYDTVRITPSPDPNNETTNPNHRAAAAYYIAAACPPRWNPEYLSEAPGLNLLYAWQAIHGINLLPTLPAQHPLPKNMLSIHWPRLILALLVVAVLVCGIIYIVENFDRIMAYFR